MLKKRCNSSLLIGFGIFTIAFFLKGSGLSPFGMNFMFQIDQDNCEKNNCGLIEIKTISPGTPTNVNNLSNLLSFLLRCGTRPFEWGNQ